MSSRGFAGTPRFVKGTLHGFGGAKVEVNTKKETRIQLDDIEVVADLWEVPDEAQSEDMIIERDIMAQPEINVTYKEGKVSFSKDKESTETKEKTHTLNKERGEERGTEITEAEVRIEGSETMKRAVKTLLNKYRDCFAKEMNEVGAAKGVHNGNRAKRRWPNISETQKTTLGTRKRGPRNRTRTAGERYNRTLGIGI
ncbi:uncharacterized protein LOC121589999 [Anopheles merus]|uniref:uncharacterized protein LOC121589999 n=1 Tax=Anopheles merus TaxID=30066 RepID=UPI001BE3D1D5|nr:uncharacterized protein LOC121589999 [Anopheles merus]